MLTTFAERRASFEQSTQSENHQVRGRFGVRSMQRTDSTASKKAKGHWGKLMESVHAAEGKIENLKTIVQKRAFVCIGCSLLVRTPICHPLACCKGLDCVFNGS